MTRRTSRLLTLDSATRLLQITSSTPSVAHREGLFHCFFFFFFSLSNQLTLLSLARFYAAPEMILGKRYEGPEVDLWSLGVILFALLCGHLPFDDDDVKELYRKISTASYASPSYLTESSKDLISRMITVHPKKRATLQEVKNHPWTNEGYDGPPPNYIPARAPFTPEELETDIVDKLESFGYNKDDLVKPTEEGEPNAVRSTYYLVQEMFRREEEKFKKLRDQPRLDVTGRSNLEILGAITEDGAEEEFDEDTDLPSITIPSTPVSPGLASASSPAVPSSTSSSKYSKILDDFSRNSHSPTNTPGGPEVAYHRGRRASTSSASVSSSPTPSNVAPPLFPNKNVSCCFPHCFFFCCCCSHHFLPLPY